MFVPPPVDDDDIQWACEVIGLLATAFTGTDGTDPRAEVLLSNETLDIEACPGSGKTTLLVAKLAILARKWNARRSGICVLSHTNAARREIERCLGRTAEGTKLLSYPHFVGTIHGFVNEFLAMPWLRSLGYPVTAIDDALCEQHRRRLLEQNRFATLNAHANFKERQPHANYVSQWFVSSPEFLVLDDKGEAFFNDPDVASAQQLCRLAKQCTEDGFFRYEELFMWANDLLNKHPEATSAIRQRFPLLFIDEVQDNSEPQSRLLQRVFVEGADPVIRQRYGDSNQAIYAHAQAGGAQSDPFPAEAVRRDIPNSHRFGQQIADIANPFALRPQNLQGVGPPAQMIRSDTAKQHAVLLFNDDSMANVLNCYGSYLVELFSDEELQAGTFTAVGAVHRPGDDTNLPRFVGHYWSEYDHELGYSEPRPNTFHQYVAAGWASIGKSGDLHAVVERIAEGVLRAVQIAEPTTRIGQRKRKHRYVLESLDQTPGLKDRYLSLVLRFVNDEREVTTNEWQENWAPVVLQLAETLGGIDIDPAHLDGFLVWPADAPEEAAARKVRRKDNHYRYPIDAPALRIRVGSIHSVKGETHTATLVLETYYRGHHLSRLKPWLLGANVGGTGQNRTVTSSLRQHYVAFTRPTHLLCIAMRDDLTAAEIQTLKERTWRVGRVQNGGGIEWL